MRRSATMFLIRLIIPTLAVLVTVGSLGMVLAQTTIYVDATTYFIVRSATQPYVGGGSNVPQIYGTTGYVIAPPATIKGLQYPAAASTLDIIRGPNSPDAAACYNVTRTAGSTYSNQPMFIPMNTRAEFVGGINSNLVGWGAAALPNSGITKTACLPGIPCTATTFSQPAAPAVPLCSVNLPAGINTLSASCTGIGCSGTVSATCNNGTWTLNNNCTPRCPGGINYTVSGCGTATGLSTGALNSTATGNYCPGACAGSMTFTCTQDAGNTWLANWQVTNQNCAVPTSCNNLPANSTECPLDLIPPSVTQNYTLVTTCPSGADCKAKCNAGYALACVAQSISLNGTSATFPATYAGQTGSGTCASGSGTASATCGANGTWGAATGTCCPAGQTWDSNTNTCCAWTCNAYTSATCNGTTTYNAVCDIADHVGSAWGGCGDTGTCSGPGVNGFGFPCPTGTTMIYCGSLNDGPNCNNSYLRLHYICICPVAGQIWNGSACVAAPSTCPATVVAAPGGNVTLPASPAGTTGVSTPCPAGYSGNVTGDCQLNGTWTNISTAMCSVSNCIGYTHSAYGYSFPIPNTPINTWANVACSTQIPATSGTVTRQCLASGAWAGASATDNCRCTANTVAAPGGNVTLPQTPLGQSATPQPCAGGYTGTVTGTCNTNGTWSAVANTCTAPTTCDPASPTITIGSGTAGDPYLVCNCQQLQTIATKGLNKQYQLTQNIDCSATSTWNGGAGFVPIDSFTGSLNGFGYKITSMTINLPASPNCVGLFGCFMTGQISNLGLEGINFTGKNNVGGLAGIGGGASFLISNSYATGTITQTGVPGGTAAGYAGGLIGENTGGGTITKSYAAVNVSGPGDNMGGLIGLNNSALQITDSYATGNVSGHQLVGGFVGIMAQGSIANAYASGNVTASVSLAGGFAGQTGGSLTNVFANGVVTTPYPTGAGLVDGVSGGTISNSFYGSNTGFQRCTGGGGLPGCKKIYDWNQNYWSLKTLPPMSSWDFTNTWQDVPCNYPNLRNIGGTQHTSNGTSCEFDCATLTDTACDATPTCMFTNVYITPTAHGTTRTQIAFDLAVNVYNNWPTDLGLTCPAGQNAWVTSAYCVGVQAWTNINYQCCPTGQTWNGSACVAGLTITTATPLPGATRSTAYSLTFAATGGTTPYSWSRTAGTLPTGLSLTAGGVLSGTPSAAGTFSFDVKVTDSASPSNTATKTFSLTVNAAMTITTASPLPAGTVGTAYSQTFAASGGTTPYSWSKTAGTLPAGLSLDSATGTLSGTPTTAGTSNFTIQVTDQASATATKAFSLTVAACTAETNTAFCTRLGKTCGSVTANDNCGTSRTVNCGSCSGCQACNGSGQCVAVTLPGSGTAGSPYLLSACSDLLCIPVGATATYQLTQNIDCSASSSWNGGGGITGYYGMTNFAGTLDGNHKIISNLYTHTAGNPVGLIPFSINSFTVKDLGLENVDLSGVQAGGLAGGWNGPGSITNSYVTGTVAGSQSAGCLVGLNGSGAVGSGGLIQNSWASCSASGSAGKAGGLVGENYGSISSSYAKGTTTGAGRIGGLVGYNHQGGTIGSSYATGNVTSSQPYVGGLVGYNNGPISNSYAIGNVSGTSNVGGLVGYQIDGGSTAPVTASYSTGSVSGSGTDKGGFIGTLYGSSTAPANCRWDATRSGRANACGTGTCSGATAFSASTDAYLKTEAPLSSWDFATTWQDVGCNYPNLRNASGTQNADNGTSCIPLITTATPLPGGTSGTAYSQTFAASNGTAPYSWSTTAGTLPTGLSLSAAGVLSGTPSATGTFSFDVKVIDSASHAATKTFSLTVCPVGQMWDGSSCVVWPVAFTNPASDTTYNIVDGTAFSLQLTASGGSGTYRYSINSGTLWSGLTLTPLGLISGRVITAEGNGDTGSGPRTVQIKVRDLNNIMNYSLVTLTFHITPSPLRVTCPTANDACPGQGYPPAYEASFSPYVTASGGTGPYTFSGGTGLPPDLTIAPSGLISGYVEGFDNGYYNFGVTVTDTSNGDTRNFSPCTIDVFTWPGYC